MLPANVKITNIDRESGRIIDGTTEKSIRFVIQWPPDGLKFDHVITDGSRSLDEQIALLEAHGGITVQADEFQGNIPTPEWLETVTRRALEKAGNLSWDGWSV